MADSYRSKPRKVMAKRRREANPGFRTRVIERRPNHGDGYPLNKKLINKIFDIIPDEYLFGLKSIELKPRGERFPGQPLGTYNRRTQHIIIYSYPVNRMLHYADFEDTEKWKEVFRIWADLPAEKDFRKDAQMIESISDCALFCKVLFHEIGHHYTYNYKTRNKPARKKEHIELQAELFGPRIMMEVISELKEIIPSPFTFDNETRFSSAIRRGTGETHLILKENPDKDFSEIILHAVLNNLSWYGFSDRKEYHYEIINLSAQKDKLKQSIIKKLRQSRDTYLSDRLMAIVAFFAREGNKKALAALYDAFQKRVKKEARFRGYEKDIITIDGLKGLITIAEIAGEVITNDRKLENHRASYEANTEIIDFLQAEKPEINVIEELEKLSEANAYIKNFLTSYKNRLKNKKEERSLNPKNKTTELDYETLIKNIKSKRYFSIPLDDLKRNISEADIIKLADKLIKEKDIELLMGYLRVFSSIKFPYDYKYILDILKNADNKNTISEYAVKALSCFKSKELRDFALNQIANADVPSLFVGLLINNYKEGDSQLLTDLLENTHSENQLENMMHDIKAIYRKNKTAECLHPLLAAYIKHNCDMCREDIIAILIENHVLPDKILKEMQYDSSAEVRSMYEKFSKK